MRVLITGEWIDVADNDPEWPKTVKWDESLTTNPDAATVDSRGCPPGYFCEYVAPAQHWYNPFYTVDASNAFMRICRRADEGIVNNPDALKDETGPGLWDKNVTEIAAASKKVVEAAVPVGLGMIVVGLAALLILVRAR